MEEFKLQETTDLELVLGWIGHIEKPCEDKKGNNVRNVYLREVKNILKTRKFTNPHAKELLEDVVKKYDNIKEQLKN